MPGRVGQGVDGAVEGMACRVVAVMKQRGDGVVDHLDDDVGRLVVLIDRPVHEGHALVDAAGELELEVGQAVVADAAAKAHDGRFADVGAVGQFADRQAGKAAGVGQQQPGHTLLGRRQGGQGGLDALQDAHCSSAHAKPSRATSALAAAGPHDPAAYGRGPLSSSAQASRMGSTQRQACSCSSLRTKRLRRPAMASSSRRS
mmetsp:Transcript_18060/g.43071  ORF Transcript_18060/g.43071 Transcript_18060/m.43071 type:complete len:202 (+) Transcript_18060:2905-3510(+)